MGCRCAVALRTFRPCCDEGYATRMQHNTPPHERLRSVHNCSLSTGCHGHFLSARPSAVFQSVLMQHCCDCAKPLRLLAAEVARAADWRAAIMHCNRHMLMEKSKQK